MFVFKSNLPEAILLLKKPFHLRAVVVLKGLEFEALVINNQIFVRISLSFSAPTVFLMLTFII